MPAVLLARNLASLFCSCTVVAFGVSSTRFYIRGEAQLKKSPSSSGNIRYSNGIHRESLDMFESSVWLSLNASNVTGIRLVFSVLHYWGMMAEVSEKHLPGWV